MTVFPPAGSGLDESFIGLTLKERFELHHAMFRKLADRDPISETHVAEFLEDVANRYLDISEFLQGQARHPGRLNSIA